jgi:hypothetical protein
VTFEETAVATVPPPATEVPAFVPLTPTPGATNTVENNQIGSPITHEIAGREECDTCHGPEGIRPYPADHAERPNESCQICHAPGPTPTPGGAQPEGGSGQPNPIPHPIEGDTYQDCTTCHGAGQMKPFPENHNSFTSDSCTACHPAAEGGAPAAGETPAAGAAANPIPHPIDTEAYEVCTACHGEGQVKPFPANHKTFPPDTCTTCHQPAEAATPAADETRETEGGAPAGPLAMPANHDPDAPAYQDCTACHGEGQVKPFPANHVGFPKDSCTGCHKPASEAGGAPAASGGANSGGSSASAAPLMPAFHIPTSEGYKDCIKCHGEGAIQPFPANHASFTVETCTTCHQLAQE